MRKNWDETIARPPLIPSATVADRQSQEWFAINQWHELVDGDGLVWHWDIQTQQTPNPLDPKFAVWRATCCPTVRVGCADLIRTGTLDAEADQRFIELLGDTTWPMAMRPLELTASSDEELRSQMVDRLPTFRQHFKSLSLHEIKRALAARWLEKRSEFGGSWL